MRVVAGLLLGLLLTVGVVAQGDVIDVTTDACAGGLADSTPRYAVVSAFEPELVLHIAQAEVEAQYPIGGRLFTTGTLAGQPVVMFNSGRSMVNPAITLQDACYQFNIASGVLFSGIAGAMSEAVNIGDVAIPARWREYWHALLARENPDGTYQIPGFYPGNPEQNFGFVHPMPVDYTVRDGVPDEVLSADWFEASADFLAVAERALEGVELLDCTPAGVCLSEEPKVVLGGNGVSGDTYMDNAAVRAWVSEHWQADVLDMESASVAHWASNRGVPFLVFRSASDLAGGGPAENEKLIFLELAADNGARVLHAVLAALPAPA